MCAADRYAVTNNEVAVPRSVKTNRTNGEAPHSTKRNGAAPRANGESASSPKGASGATPAKPTDLAAMQDAVAFVDAVAARVNLVQRSADLVGSKDEKIAKSELDRLRDMKFGKVSVAGGPSEEPQQLIIDVPRPDRE